jgi:hypothetical protein
MKGKLRMSQRRKYGIACKHCSHPILLGDIELPDNAQREDLLNALVAQGWKAPIVRCSDPSCSHERWTALEEVNLLD